MRQLMLPNKSQRQLELIRFFFANRGKLFNYDDLAAILDSSISVVFSDIQDIELSFTEELQVERQSKQGITLKIKPHLSYNYFFKKYAQNSTEFRLLDGLIHQRYQRMNQAADDLFVSRTTISRAIDHMNEFFNHRGWPILVQRSPMSLKMDETIYRQVYPLFVDAFYFLKDWPFDQVSYSAIHEFFNQFAKVSTFFTMAQRYPITYIRLACNLTRYLD
ncbi:hypothetical protein AWM75_00815 [Aerococcus urinaehominis]|uniref:Uncharacterized protein n=1 Tax=Aerococcus urinaehominis TaxID=128944 RepID=A0A0X8FJS4_9LACT|nr:helix-turn-helix domain-containing protein [Aerococcus urinaehominis]AMB98623.1 hypothetical protein AWM75_00815 [Aerococcus urinaehominis]SDL95683.1 Mga helix-turn-helix domain-containing protein [Aerococcus urinaehominis]